MPSKVSDNKAGDNSALGIEATDSKPAERRTAESNAADNNAAWSKTIGASKSKTKKRKGAGGARNNASKKQLAATQGAAEAKPADTRAPAETNNVQPDPTPTQTTDNHPMDNATKNQPDTTPGNVTPSQTKANQPMDNVGTAYVDMIQGNANMTQTTENFTKSTAVSKPSGVIPGTARAPMPTNKELFYADDIAKRAFDKETMENHIRCQKCCNALLSMFLILIASGVIGCGFVFVWFGPMWDSTAQSALIEELRLAIDNAPNVDPAEFEERLTSLRAQIQTAERTEASLRADFEAIPPAIPTFNPRNCTFRSNVRLFSSSQQDTTVSSLTVPEPTDPPNMVAIGVSCNGRNALAVQVVKEELLENTLPPRDLYHCICSDWVDRERFVERDCVITYWLCQAPT